MKTNTNHYQYQANYREVNKEKLRVQQAEWRKNNPDKVRANSLAFAQRRKGKAPVITVSQPDPLLENIRINPTPEQEAYLKLNREMARPQLFKLFRTKFNSNINKLQFNFALEDVGSKRKKLA